MSKAIILIGPICCGKSWQGQALVPYGYQSIDASSVIQRAATGEGPGAEELRYWRDHGNAQGEPAPEHVVRMIIDDEIRRCVPRDLVLAGLPRYATQADWVIPELRRKGYSDIITYLMDIPDDEIRRRAANADRQHRIDAAPEAVERRIRLARENLGSVISELQHHDVAIKTIDGMWDRDKITHTILDHAGHRQEILTAS